MTGVVLLAALAAAPADPWLELPEVRHGPVVARLAVRVMASGSAPGRGRVRFRLRVEGPRGLQADGPQLEDALAGWRVAWQASSWVEDDPTVWEQTWQLDQTKAGAVPLPGIRVRVRSTGAGPWQEASWPEPLREPRDVPPPIPIPPAPRSPWPARLRTAAVLVACLLAVALLARRVRRWLRARRAPPSAEERALASIETITRSDAPPARRLADLAAVTRDFVAEAWGLPLGRRTSADLLAALEAAGVDGPTCEATKALLTTADLVKFAAVAVDAAAVDRAAEQARRTITATARHRQESPVGEARTTGENDQSGEAG